MFYRQHSPKLDKFSLLFGLGSSRDQRSDTPPHQHCLEAVVVVGILHVDVPHLARVLGDESGVCETVIKQVTIQNIIIGISVNHPTQADKCSICVTVNDLENGEYNR